MREEKGGKKGARATPESCTQTNHKIPTEATKPGRGLMRVAPAHSVCVCVDLLVCVHQI